MSEQRWGFHFFLKPQDFFLFFSVRWLKVRVGGERLIQRWMRASSKTILYFHSRTQAWEECWSTEAKYLFFLQCMYEASLKIVAFFRWPSGMTEAWPGWENNAAAPIQRRLLFNWHIIILSSSLEILEKSPNVWREPGTLIDKHFFFFF